MHRAPIIPSTTAVLFRMVGRSVTERGGSSSARRTLIRPPSTALREFEILLPSKSVFLRIKDFSPRCRSLIRCLVLVFVRRSLRGSSFQPCIDGPAETMSENQLFPDHLNGRSSRRFGAVIRSASNPSIPRIVSCEPFLRHSRGKILSSHRSHGMR